MEEISDISDVSADEIEVRLVASERLISRLRTEQATLLAEVDRRQLPLADGCRSLSEWAAGRLDVNRQTAGSLVGASRRLADQPELAHAAASGGLSFDRTVLLARVGAVPADFAHLGLAALSQVTAGHTITSTSEHDQFARRALFLQPTLDMAAWKLWGTLPGRDGQIVQTALFAKADEFPEDSRGSSRATRHADALTAICLDSLTGSSEHSVGESSSIDLASLTVFVDSRLGTNGYTSGGPVMGPNTLNEIACLGTVDILSVGESGEPLNVGRKTRSIPPRLRRFVIGRDRGCTAAGCTSRYRLQVHHKLHWADGGRTDADNLTTLCWYHHHVVIHQRGFTIDPDSPPQQLRFKRPPIRGP